MGKSSDLPTTVPSHAFCPPGSLRVGDQPFALVPEWVIDPDNSDPAFRVDSLLLRYGNTSGQRMPSRRLLAVRLRRSVDAVDRAVRQLVENGLVRIEFHRGGRPHATTAPLSAGVATDPLPTPHRRHRRRGSMSRPVGPRFCRWSHTWGSWASPAGAA